MTTTCGITVQSSYSCIVDRTRCYHFTLTIVFINNIIAMKWLLLIFTGLLVLASTVMAMKDTDPYCMDDSEDFDSEEEVTPKPVKPRCPRNMIWADKATTCTDMCNRELALCLPGKAEGRCVCNTEAGYFMNENGKCVPKNKCPGQTTPGEDTCDSETEIWNECGTICANNCDPTRVCTQQCTPLCVCNADKGFLRNSEGKCVPKQECPGETTPGEESCDPEKEIWTECGNSCTNNCSPNLFCKQKCQPQCVCNAAEGYFRNPKGKCVSREKCPKEECDPKTEIWSDCADSCTNHCDERLQCRQICRPQCICNAKAGYYRSYESGCVQKEDCDNPV